MQKIQESVLYYHNGDAKSAGKVLSVFVRLGIRIRRVEPDQVMEKVGYLAGLPGYTPANQGEEAAENPVPKIQESVLIMRNFSGGRLDYLLYNLRKSGVPPIPQKPAEKLPVQLFRAPLGHGGTGTAPVFPLPPDHPLQTGPSGKLEQ